MSRYDITDAADFLENELCATPEQLRDEIVEAMHLVTLIENKRNTRYVDAVWHTLLTCADFMERFGKVMERVG